jgi:pyruvate/2-oxoglutarate dehydrogenase complex dihydrolipoamide acyltransferase (E2) component
MIKLIDILFERDLSAKEEKIVKALKKTGNFKKNDPALYAIAASKAEALDPVGKEDDDINNDGKVDKTDKYLSNRRKAVAANIKEGDHEVSMAVSSLEAIAEAIVELRQKLGNQERNIPGWIQDHIAKAENYIEQAAQGFHEIKDKEESIQENVKIRTEPAGFRGVEKIISSKDKAAVEQAIEKIEREYPSAGYGTNVKKMTQMPSGVWVAVVRHSTTSD